MLLRLIVGHFGVLDTQQQHQEQLAWNTLHAFIQSEEQCGMNFVSNISCH